MQLSLRKSEFSFRRVDAVVSIAKLGHIVNFDSPQSLFDKPQKDSAKMLIPHWDRRVELNCRICETAAVA